MAKEPIIVVYDSKELTLGEGIAMASEWTLQQESEREWKLDSAVMDTTVRNQKQREKKLERWEIEFAAFIRLNLFR